MGKAYWNVMPACMPCTNDGEWNDKNEVGDKEDVDGKAMTTTVVS